MIAWLRRQAVRFQRLIKYGICGCINTMVDYAVFAVMREALGVPAGYSQIAGFLCGSVNGYLLNSNTTFKEGKGRTKGQFLQYLAVDIVLALASSRIMDAAESHGWPIYFSKICVTGLIWVLHYLVFKYVVFKIGKEDSSK